MITINPKIGKSYRIKDETAMQIYRYTSENNAMSVKELAKIFNLKQTQVSELLKSVFIYHQSIINNIKRGNPTVQEFAEVKLLDLESVICASFANLTVGDCVFKRGKIIDIKGSN